MIEDDHSQYVQGDEDDIDDICAEQEANEQRNKSSHYSEQEDLDVWIIAEVEAITLQCVQEI